MRKARPLIDQVVLPFLVPGNEAKQPFEPMKVYVYQRHAGEEKDMAAVRHALEACLEGAPPRLAHDPFARPFGAVARQSKPLVQRQSAIHPLVEQGSVGKLVSSPQPPRQRRWPAGPGCVLGMPSSLGVKVPRTT